MRNIMFLLCLLFISKLHAEILIENFENISFFSQNKAKLAEMEISSVTGNKDKAIRIDFDLINDHFVEIFRPLSIDLNDVRAFTWYMKGNANGQIVEIKLVDEDGSIFGKKIPISGIKESEWKKFTLPISDCHYMWGGNLSIDKIVSLYIALSRGLPKKTYVLIDEFGYDEKKPGEPYFEIHINQVGYHPTDKKFFVVRVREVAANQKLEGDFKVLDTRNNKAVLLGKLNQQSFSDWDGLFLKGDFSNLNHLGKYKIIVNLKTGNKTFSKQSYTFEIHDTILGSRTLIPALTYLGYQRCGIRCHKQDPVMGGYHDTLYDISKRMWSIPSLVYGMARYVQEGAVHLDDNQNGTADDTEELIWGFEFISKIPEPDGTVSWGGIESDFKKFMTYEQFIARIGPLKPEEDNLPRIKYKDKNFHSTVFNTVAQIQSLNTLKKQSLSQKEQAEKNIFNAWNWIEKQRLSEARDLGAYLWVATELYDYTQDKKYLGRVEQVLPLLLKLQALNYNQFENNTCGDFFTSTSDKNFINQYKYIYFNIAINLALLNLLNIVSKDDPLWFEVYYANYVYGENYLKGLASKTPYEQIALGLESENSVQTSGQKPIQYETMQDKDATMDFNILSQNNEKVLHMNFNMSNGFWVQIRRDSPDNYMGIKAVRFQYKYSGLNNNLDFKFMDQDDSNYGVVIPLQKTNDWKTEQIDFSQFKYKWGGDRVLDLNNIKTIWIALAKKEGGHGSFDIKNIEWLDNNDIIRPILIDNQSSDQFYKLNYFAGKEAEKAAAGNHGLNCDMMGRGYIAMKWGAYIEDLSLEEFADNQMNWVLGVNPLDYCMVMGVGANEPTIMAEYYDKPKLPGLIPNGIVGGKNEEPEWWGDGPSSGEDWLPHNAAYFQIMSVLDSAPELQGKILSNGKLVPLAIVKILQGNKLVKQVTTKKDGAFGPIKLPAQQSYRIVAIKGTKTISKTVHLLSGSKKNILLDFDRNIKIDIKTPVTIVAGEKNSFIIALSQNAVGNIYKVNLKGGTCDFPLQGKITKPLIKLDITPSGDKPLLLRFEIEGEPIISKDVYIKAM